MKTKDTNRLEERPDAEGVTCRWSRDAHGGVVARERKAIDPSGHTVWLPPGAPLPSDDGWRWWSEGS